MSEMNQRLLISHRECALLKSCVHLIQMSDWELRRLSSSVPPAATGRRRQCRQEGDDAGPPLAQQQQLLVNVLTSTARVLMNLSHDNGSICSPSST